MPAAPRPKPLPHIVVLGAGLAGLTFAKRFPDHLARITVVDRTNHHLFQPLLYQVATAGLAVPDIAQLVRSIPAHKRSVTVRMDEVNRIDLPSRTVHLSSGPLTYDHLVVALGGRTSYFGHPEWERHAPGLKSIDDAIRIRGEVLHALERAAMCSDPAERQRLMTIVVIGGGPTGVELAGAFAELQRKALARGFRNLDLRTARVILIEGGPRLLAHLPPPLSEKARSQLESLGVAVWLGTRVSEISAGTVVTPNETLRAANIIWAAGIAASPLGTQLHTPTDRVGRVLVEPDLSLSGYPEVRVLGDMAAHTSANGQLTPGMCPAAMQMGAYAAAGIAADLRSPQATPLPRAPFHYQDKGIMATSGRSRAVALIGRFGLSGLPAWLAWLGLHLVFLVGFRNKPSVMLSWIQSYLSFKRGARMIYGATRPES